MLLAIDTATRWLGLALFDESGVAAEWGWRCRNRHTESLAPAVARLLGDAGITAAQLRCLGVAIGPGSYTGLRVGLGFAKGLALAQALPLVAVPTLDIVAAGQPESTGALVAVAATGRGRVLAATYRWKRASGWQPHSAPVVAAWETLLEEAAMATVFAGEINPDAARMIRNEGRHFRVASAAANARRPALLAELAWERWRRGEVADPATLAPDYQRNPDGSAP